MNRYFRFSSASAIAVICCALTSGADVTIKVTDGRFNGDTKAVAHPNFPGGYFIGWLCDAYKLPNWAEYTVPGVPSEGLYLVDFPYVAGDLFDTLEVNINGGPIIYYIFPKNCEWDPPEQRQPTIRTDTLNFKSGENTVRFSAQHRGPDIGQFTVHTDTPLKTSKVSSPIFDKTTTTFTDSLTVTITDTTINSAIFYSIRGGAFQAYTKSITLKDSATIKAYATATGMAPSDTVSKTYACSNCGATGTRVILSKPSGVASPSAIFDGTGKKVKGLPAGTAISKVSITPGMYIARNKNNGVTRIISGK
jgi:hypothetical protein